MNFYCALGPNDLKSELSILLPKNVFFCSSSYCASERKGEKSVCRTRSQCFLAVFGGRSTETQHLLDPVSPNLWKDGDI